MKELFKKILPSFLIDWYHFLLAFSGAIFYQFPGKKMIIVGVTGTNGKSTVVELISKILEEAGISIASFSSIRFKIAGKEQPNLLKMTMPGRLQLQRFLRRALNAGCRYGVIEVTSEGIKQHRHRFINFQAAVFTNLTPEHIEAHGSFEKYKKEKGKLFEATQGVHVINIDDENSKYFLKFPAKKKYTFGLNQGDINYQNSNFKLHLIGDFNIYNGLAAICVAKSQGVDFEIAKRALEKVQGIPGRMEEVISQPFKVFVDYAFTPNALAKVYQTLTQSLNHSATQSLICVLGAAGGGRDKWKRPVLGKIAAKYCQKIIITNEDPYDEDPSKILSEIKFGISNSQFPLANFFEILDRREAIKKALSLAKPNNTVIITGKGSEPWICVEKGKKIPWDDRKVVREEFAKLKIQ